MSTVAEILQMKADLANKVREYVTLQRSLWCQVPYSAATANRNGYSHFLRIAVIKKLWAVDMGNRLLYIDCKNFRILNEKYEPASDDEVLTLLDHLERLSVSDILDRLDHRRAGARRPSNRWHMHDDERAMIEGSPS